MNRLYYNVAMQCLETIYYFHIFNTYEQTTETIFKNCLLNNVRKIMNIPKDINIYIFIEFSSKIL